MTMNITLAAQRAVRGFLLGTKALAAALAERLDYSISETTINHKASPTYPAQFFSPNELVLLMEVTGDHSALVAMCEALGYVPMPLARTLAGDDQACLNSQLAAVREFADLMSVFSKALEPEQTARGEWISEFVSDNELASVEKEAAEVIKAVQNIVAIAAARNLQGKPAHERITN